MEGQSTTDVIIKLNVGGTTFQTLKSTLLVSPYFESLLGGQWQGEDATEIFVDEDPSAFSYLLDVLRHGQPRSCRIPQKYRYIFDTYCIKLRDCVTVSNQTLSPAFIPHKPVQCGNEPSEYVGGIYTILSAGNIDSKRCSGSPIDSKILSSIGGSEGLSNVSLRQANTNLHTLAQKVTITAEPHKTETNLTFPVDYLGQVTLDLYIPELPGQLEWIPCFLERLVDRISFIVEGKVIKNISGAIFVDLAKIHGQWPRTNEMYKTARYVRIPLCFPTGIDYFKISGGPISAVVRWNSIVNCIIPNPSQVELGQIAPLEFRWSIETILFCNKLGDALQNGAYPQTVHSYDATSLVLEPAMTLGTDEIEIRLDTFRMNLVTGAMIKCLVEGDIPFDYMDFYLNGILLKRHTTLDGLDYNWRFCHVKPPKRSIYPCILFPLSSEMFNIEQNYPVTNNAKRSDHAQMIFHMKSTFNCSYPIEINWHTIDMGIYRDGSFKLYQDYLLTRHLLTRQQSD